MNTDTYKVRLLEEQATLEASLSSVGRRNPHNPSDWEPVPAEVGMEADENDQAEHLESYAENTAILSELEIRYNAVLSALARIENGTYGICSVSGEKIEVARLTADPAATTCKAHLR